MLSPYSTKHCRTRRRRRRRALQSGGTVRIVFAKIAVGRARAAVHKAKVRSGSLRLRFVMGHASNIAKCADARLVRWRCRGALRAPSLLRLRRSRRRRTAGAIVRLQSLMSVEPPWTDSAGKGVARGRKCLSRGGEHCVRRACLGYVTPCLANALWRRACRGSAPPLAVRTVQVLPASGQRCSREEIACVVHPGRFDGPITS